MSISIRPNWILIFVVSVLREGLAKNFSLVEVNVVSCPDLSTAPFDLADKGCSLFLFLSYIYLTQTLLHSEFAI